MAILRQSKKAFTLTGEPVWTNGNGKFWIGERGHGLSASELLYGQDWDLQYLNVRAKRIEKRIGQPVEWIDTEPVKTHPL